MNETVAKVPQVQAQADNLTMETNKLYELVNQLMTRLNNAGIMIPTEQPKDTGAVPPPPPQLVPLAKSIYDSTQTLRSASRLIDDILGNLEV